MEWFSNEQRVLIVKTDYKNGECYAETVRKLRAIFGRDNAPAATTVSRLVQKFEESGSVATRKSPGRNGNVRTKQNIALVQDSVRLRPVKSYLRCSQQIVVRTANMNQTEETNKTLVEFEECIVNSCDIKDGIKKERLDYEDPLHLLSNVKLERFEQSPQIEAAFNEELEEDYKTSFSEQIDIHDEKITVKLENECETLLTVKCEESYKNNENGSIAFDPSMLHEEVQLKMDPAFEANEVAAEDNVVEKTENSEESSLVVEPDSEYKCKHCTRCFTVLKIYERHVKSCSKNPENYSQTCEPGASSSRYRANKQHECVQCGNRYTHPRELKRHMKLHNEQELYPCTICQKTCKTTTELKIHMRVHTGEKPYTCPVCNTGFTTASDLTKHKRTHTRERPFKCEQCNRAFSQSSALKTHMRIHTKEKPFECDVCNKTFSHSHSLIKHKRIHAGEKPYTCEVCNKAFTVDSHLTGHMRTHTGERPYKCHICDQTYTQSGHLTNHIRRKHIQ